MHRPIVSIGLARLSMLLAAAALSACATLPDVHYLHDRQLVPRNDPTIVGTDGALPQAKANALLHRLERRAGVSERLARHVAAEEVISGQPLVAGNQVGLLDDGPATMRAMMTAVRTARNHINLETYIFEADEVGQALADLLIEKRAAGVVVNLIYDSVGALGTPREFFERMRQAGVRVLEFNPVNPLHAKRGWDINQRDHRKLLVVDGKVAFTGGVNISEVYGKSSFLQKQHHPPQDADEAAWRDTHMRIEGPVVAEFQKLFLGTWLRQTGEVLEDANYFPPLKKQGDALVRAIGSTPANEDFSVYKTYLTALAHADDYAHLTMAYFVPDQQMLQAMLDAARRGVDVRVIFPSLTDVGVVLNAGRSYYDALLSAGVRVYERKAAVLHAKTAVVDGVWSTIGSTNLDMRSFLYNDELNAVILDVDFAEKMDTLFQRDLRESTEITAEAWSRRGFRQRLREWTARMLEYWL